MFYISKFSGQDGSPTLSSPVMFRLAEIYLNRAEAYAKKGDVASRCCRFKYVARKPTDCS